MMVSAQVAEDMRFGEHPDWEWVGSDELVEQLRWVTVHSQLYRHTPTNMVYSMYFEEGSTECQECDWPYGEDQELTEMEEVEVTEKKWVPVEDTE